MMGTRCGDMDPAIIFFLMDRKNMSAAEVNEMLNKKSGILGLAGIGSNDVRDLEKKIGEGHKQAEECLDVFCYRIRKYIGSYLAAMGGVDAIVFTAGIGENSATVRARVCEGMEGLGVVLDPGKNLALNHAARRNPQTGKPGEDPHHSHQRGTGDCPRHARSAHRKRSRLTTRQPLTVIARKTVIRDRCPLIGEKPGTAGGGFLCGSRKRKPRRNFSSRIFMCHFRT